MPERACMAWETTMGVGGSRFHANIALLLKVLICDLVVLSPPIDRACCLSPPRQALCDQGTGVLQPAERPLPSSLRFCGVEVANMAGTWASTHSDAARRNTPWLAEHPPNCKLVTDRQRPSHIHAHSCACAVASVDSILSAQASSP